MEEQKEKLYCVASFFSTDENSKVQLFASVMTKEDIRQTAIDIVKEGKDWRELLIISDGETYEIINTPSMHFSDKNNVIQLPDDWFNQKD